MIAYDPATARVLPEEHVAHVVEHDLSGVQQQEAQLEQRRQAMATAANTAHTRNAMLRWGAGIAAVVLATGLAVTGILWGIHRLKEEPLPTIIEKPVIVDREKPIIIEKEKPIIVEPRVIERPVPATPPGGPQSQAEAIKQRLKETKTVTDFTIFHHARLPGRSHLTVETGWAYPNAEATAPSSQWCYVSNAATGLDYQFAQNGKLAPFNADRAMRAGVNADDLASAFPYCRWFDGTAPANIRPAN
jgi:hypothetical protein